MKQPEGFVEPGYEDYVAKLVHTIYGTMQGGHDWYQTLSGTYDDLGYKIPIPMTPLEHRVVMRKQRGGRTRLERFGK